MVYVLHHPAYTRLPDFLGFFQETLKGTHKKGAAQLRNLESLKQV